jgi:hypothetical protein
MIGEPEIIAQEIYKTYQRIAMTYPVFPMDPNTP